MMVEVRRDGEDGDVADSHAAFARLADASARLFAEQAAAMAAMTAFGISVAGQMTGLVLGALKPAEEKAVGPRSERVAISVAQTDGNVVHLRSKAEVQKQAPQPRMKSGARPAKAASRSTTTAAVPAKAAAKVGVSKAAPKSTPAKEPAADDLKRISGIGPRLEKVLNGRGISSYAGIAGLSAAALKKIDEELGLEGRIVRDDWVGQARALATGGPDAAR